MDEGAFAKTRPADYLQRVADSDAGRAYKSQAITELDIRAAQTVVDLGCGPGTDLESFAEATGPNGVVVGLDWDVEALAVAGRIAAAFPWVHVRSADIHATYIPDASADRAHTDRVLQHVADPAVVVREARRMLRRRGRAVFAEPDYDTLIFDYPDIRVPQAYRSFVTQRVVRNATIGRQLPRLARSAGFSSTRTIPVTSTFTDARAADEVLGLKRVTDRAAAAGYLDRRTAAHWLDYLASETFFASLTLFILVAEV